MRRLATTETPQPTLAPATVSRRGLRAIGRWVRTHAGRRIGAVRRLLRPSARVDEPARAGAPASAGAPPCDCPGPATPWPLDAVPYLAVLGTVPLARLSTKGGRSATPGVLEFPSIGWTIDATAVASPSTPTNVPTQAILCEVLRRYALQGFHRCGMVVGPVAELLGDDAADPLGPGREETERGSHAGGRQRAHVREVLEYLCQARFRTTDPSIVPVLGEAFQIFTEVAWTDGRDCEGATGNTPRREGSRYRVRLSPVLVAALRSVYVDRRYDAAAPDSAQQPCDVLDWERIRTFRAARRGRTTATGAGAALPVYVLLEAWRALGVGVPRGVSVRRGRRDAGVQRSHWAIDAQVTEVYRRVGGTAKQATASVAWDALQTGHESLSAVGVLVGLPEEASLRAEAGAECTAAAPDAAPDAEGERQQSPPPTQRAPRPWRSANCPYVLAAGPVIREASLVMWLCDAYGVWPRVRNAALRDRQEAELLAALVAAVTLGILWEPACELGQQIGGLLARQRRTGGDGIDDSRRRFLPRPGEAPAQRGQVLDALAATARAREARLTTLPDAAIRVRALEQHYSRPGRPAWVARGLAAGHLNRAFGLKPDPEKLSKSEKQARDARRAG